MIFGPKGDGEKGENRQDAEVKAQDRVGWVSAMAT